MFNVGGMELLVIGLLALVVLGPDKLPGALRQLGSFLGELRRVSKGFQVDLKSALDEAEREAEATKRAEARANASPAVAQAADNPEAGTAPDPGAAAAVARAELDELEAGAWDDAPASAAGSSAGTSADVLGAESNDVTDDRSDA